MRKSKTIFTVTTVREKDDCFPGSNDTRTVGFFWSKKDAFNALDKDPYDIEECGYYPYAVVEAMSAGVYTRRCDYRMGPPQFRANGSYTQEQQALIDAQKEEARKFYENRTHPSDQQ
jgi:hypothetical protein